MANFLGRLEVEFAQDKSMQVDYIVVDDCSTDDSIARVAALEIENVQIIRNKMNMGHGPSTVRALTEALRLQPDIVCGADGDGEVEASSLRELVLEANIGSARVVEGTRVNRSDPWFRKLASWSTRQLVLSRSGAYAIDANTPFRAYESAFLKELLTGLPVDSMIPNLHISSLTRSDRVAFSEIQVRLFTPPDYSSGVTWQQRFKALPSKRFLRFCVNAYMEWKKFK